MRLIDAEFEEKHYASMLINPTPDVTQEDKRKAQIVINALKMAKTVDAEPVRHGHWIPLYSSVESTHRFQCSECGYVHIKQPYTIEKYCSACGAKMEV